MDMRRQEAVFDKEGGGWQIVGWGGRDDLNFPRTIFFQLFRSSLQGSRISLFHGKGEKGTRLKRVSPRESGKERLQ